MDAKDLAPADDPGAHAPGAGTVARRPGCWPRAGRQRRRRRRWGGTRTPSDVGRRPSAREGPRFHEGRLCGPDIRADRWFPPALDRAQQEELKGAVEQPPAAAGIGLANWYWKVVRQFVSERFGISLCRSSCLNWLHRLGVCLQASQEAAAQG